MNYNELSDFEINKRVAIRCGINYELTEYDEVITWDDTKTGRFNTRKFNPCQNWADAGPLIEERKINLKFNHYSKIWSADNWNHEEKKNAQICAFHRDQNPLRAAMIFLLIVMEERNG